MVRSVKLAPSVAPYAAILNHVLVRSTPIVSNVEEPLQHSLCREKEEGDEEEEEYEEFGEGEGGKFCSCPGSWPPEVPRGLLSSQT